MGITGGAMKKVLGIGIAILGLAAPMSASPITGTLNFTGSVQVSATTIDWLPLATGEGVILTVAPGDEYFSTIFNPLISPAYVGDEVDLVGAPGPVTGFLNDFETPDSKYDDLTFNLSNIIAPTAPPCTGAEVINQSCSFGSFTLKPTEAGVAVNFEVRGSFVDPTFGENGTTNTAKGVYTTQLIKPTEDTIAEIMTIIGTGGSIQSGYSATYTASAIPEPATLLTFGTGSLFVAARKRRLAKKNA
jgi:hypothetical protein